MARKQVKLNKQDPGMGLYAKTEKPKAKKPAAKPKKKA